MASTPIRNSGWAASVGVVASVATAAGEDVGCGAGTVSPEKRTYMTPRKAARTATAAAAARSIRMRSCVLLA